MSFLLLAALISFSKSNENDLDMVLLDKSENDVESYFGPTQVAPTSKSPFPSSTATDVVPRSPRPTVPISPATWVDADYVFNTTTFEDGTFALFANRSVSSVTLGSVIVLPDVTVLATNLTIKHGLDLRGSAKLLAEDGASIVIEEGATIAMAIAGTDIPTLDLGQNQNWLTKVENITIDVEFLATRLPLEELEKLVWPLIIGGNVGNDQDAWRDKANFTEPTDDFRFDFGKYSGPSSSRRLIQDDRQALYLKGMGKDSDTTRGDGYGPLTGTPWDDSGLGAGSIIAIVVALIVLVVAVGVIIPYFHGNCKGDKSGEKKSNKDQKGKRDRRGEKVPSSSNSDEGSSSNSDNALSSSA